MSFNNKSFNNNFIKFGDVKCLSNFIEGDVKCLSNFIEKDEYSNEEVSEVINKNVQNENVEIPELKHIKELQNTNANE